MIYIAGPYRNDDPMQVEQNILNARTAAVMVADRGVYFPVTPHLCTGGFEHVSTASDDFYLAGTLELLKVCQAVLLLDGWELSSGSRVEVCTAINMRIRIFDSRMEPVTISSIVDIASQE